MAAPSKLGALMWDRRLHAAAAVALVAAASAAVSLSAVGPRLAAVVSFFWPLLASTAFLLAAVAVLLRISPPPDGAGATGEELIDFVAGCRLEDHHPWSRRQWRLRRRRPWKRRSRSGDMIPWPNNTYSRDPEDRR